MNMFLAFVSRDFSIERTYRFHLAIKLASVAMQLAIFFFISRFLEKPEYFVFVFIGIMFSSFFQFWLNVFAENIRQEQYWGTMEPVFLCPKPPLRVILVSATGKFILLFAEIAFLILAGKIIFGAGLKFSAAGFLPLFVINAVAFGGIGLLSGSFIMYFKRGDPVNWVMGAVFDLLSGVYFPISVLPDIAKNFSEKLPTTSALNLWRAVIINGELPNISQIIAQGAWAVILFGAGAWAFTIAFNRTRRKSELGNY
jgi:ABC-2 type transport system permease protein